MKRFLLIPLMALMCGVSVWAITPTGTSRIILKTAGQPDKEVSFILHSSFSDGFDNTYDAEAANPGGIYVYYGGERYTTWASNAYSASLHVGFATGTNTSYTLSFASWSGTTYKLYDMVEGEIIDVNASTPDYSFTATANTTYNDRFLINYPFTPSGNLETCFTGTELQITNNPIFGNIVVTRVSDSKQMDKKPYGTTSINMSSYAKGEYLVEFGKGSSKRAFIVEVK